jgi:hypothetical protein
MGGPDPLHVNVLDSALSNRFNDPEIRRKALFKLEEMQKELKHLQASIGSLQQSIRSGVQFPGNNLARTKQQIRDWALSLVESESYIETLLGGGFVTAFRFDILVGRAVRLGRERGVADGGQ